jgi:ATP-binding cassette subfamily B protein
MATRTLDTPFSVKFLWRWIALSCKPFYRRLALAGGLSVVSACLGVVGPLLSGMVFDDALFAGDSPNIGLLSVLLGLMVLGAVVGAVASIAVGWLFNSTCQEIVQKLRVDLFNHLQTLPLSFFGSVRGGDIHSRLQGDVLSFQAVLSRGATGLFATVLNFVAAVIAMLALSWQLALVSLAVVPPMWLVTKRVGLSRARVAGQAQEALSDMSSTAHEALSPQGVLFTKLSGGHGVLRNRHEAASRNYSLLYIRQQLIGETYFVLVLSIFSLAPVVVFFIAGMQISLGAHITSGSLLAITLLQARLFTPLAQLSQSLTDLGAGRVALCRILSVLDVAAEDDALAEYAGSIAATCSTEPAVSFENVKFSYDIRSEVGLHDVSFDVAFGELVAIVGPTGAGKTTISYLLSRLYEVDSGTIRIGGRDIRGMLRSELSSTVALVPQSAHLLHASVLDNLTFGLSEVAMCDVIAAAQGAGVHERITNLDAGYSTIIGEGGFRLSGGEKQRLALARAFLRKPKILVLDEATSALDSRTESLVEKAIVDRSPSGATIIISHRLASAEKADRILVVDRGRIVQVGMHCDLVKIPGLYRDLHQVQAQARDSGLDGAGIGGSTELR